MCRKKYSKILSILLTLTLTLGLSLGNCQYTDIQAATDNTVTRAEWIHNLVTTFDMSTDETSSPDNYFSDIDETTNNYADIMAAVAYGVVDIEAGQAFEPDKKVTREFAAHTLNFCLGFQLKQNESYTFTDSRSCKYPGDDQIAVNRNWFALSNGRFMPENEVTISESTYMMKDAESVLATEDVSENYDSTWKIANGVKEIPADEDVIVNENKVTITGLSQTINSGDIFVVYQGGIAIPFKAVNVSKSGNQTTITTEDVQNYGDAFANVDAEGVIESDELTFESLDGTDVEVETKDASPTQNILAARSTKKIKDAKFSKKFNLSGNIASSINGTFKNIQVKYNISTGSGETFLQVEGDLTMTGSIAATAGTSLNLMKIGVPGVGGVTLTADLKAEGRLNSTISSHVVAGLSYSKSGGFRTIRSFKENGGSNTSTEATASLGATLKCGITDMKVISGYVYAKAGVSAQIVDTTWESGQPRNCKTFLAYMYAAYGAEASCKFINYQYKNNVDVYNLSNSPMRIYHHYEDGAQVAQCSRGQTFEYFTKYYSAYWGSGWSGFGGSYGLDAEGKPYAVYEYSLAENEKGEQEATITKYHGNMRNLVIPETLDGYTVVALGNDSFSGNSYLNVLKISNNIIEIHANAFSNCSNLSDIALSENLIKMNDNVFRNCDKITEIEIPKSLEYCEDNDFADYGGPFNDCDNLKKVTFESGVTRVAARLFSRCTGLEEIILPDTIKTVDWRAFLYCKNLRSIKLSSNLVKIDGYAFQGCTSLINIEIPDTVTEIGENAFKDCSEVQTIKLSKSLTKMGANTFNNCDGISEIEIPKSLEYCDDNDFADYGGPFNDCDNLKKVTFESGVTRVAARLFSRCTGLEEITLPDTIKTVDWRAFLYCKNLRFIKLSSNLVKIDGYAFQGCTSLINIEIPDTVTEIGENAFKNCGRINQLILSNNLKTIGNNAFYNCDGISEVEIPKSLEYCDDNDFADYGGPFNDCDNLKKVTFESGATRVAARLFSRCTGLEEITLPDTIKTVDWRAFLYCKNLRQVKFSSAVEKIDGYAFKGCTSLTDIDLPESVTEIRENVFTDCTNLNKVVLSNNIVSIGEYTFSNCIQLENVKLPDKLADISHHTFYGCTSLRSIDLPETLKYIRNSAFENSGLESIKMPSNVNRIEDYAFKNTPLAKIEFSGKEQYIGREVFQNCDALTSITIPDSVTEIGNNIFQDCDTLTDVNLGTGITLIPTYAFEHCDALENIVIPYRVTKIDNNAFANCVALTDITIPRATTTIADSAFSYPTRMTVTGIAGTYAETFANSQGMKFVNNETKATDVKLSEGNIVINIYDQKLLNLTIVPSNFTDEVSWKSTNPDVVTVDNNGLVKAISRGTATIKVVVGNLSATCTITVVQPVTSIYLNERYLYLKGGEQYQLTADVYPDDANNKEVEWSSSDSSIVAVDSNGKITGISKGTATITATAKDGSGVSGTCTVTVTGTQSNVENVEDMQSPHPYDNNCTDSWVYTIKGAEALSVTFDELTELEDECDYLYIFDGSGNQIGRYTGLELAGKTITVVGDTIKVQLETDDSANEYGFKIKEIKSVKKADVTPQTPSSGQTTEKPSVKPETNVGNISDAEKNKKTDSLKKQVKPKTTTIKKLKSAKKSLKVTWKKVKGVTGYKIQYSLKKNFKKAKTKTVKKASTISLTIKNLKSKKKYYVRIRTYKVVKGKRYQSAWSKPKSKKTK